MKQGVYLAKHNGKNVIVRVMYFGCDAVCHIAFENAQWQYEVSEFDFGDNPQPLWEN